MNRDTRPLRERLDNPNPTRAASGGETAETSSAQHGPTVKRVTLFGDVLDTYQTESELNGWRPQQRRML
ncbi:MAG: hypothetical protein H0U59_10950 [Gemmatimonadaceae bacterium]|nr:hypothetical protein [Gemmatimonadaceae bacterium]